MYWVSRLFQRVLKFNNILFNFLANEQQGEGVGTCNLQSFVDEKLGVLKEELSVWDRNAGLYNKNEVFHLGRSGIRLLANVFRDNILSKFTTSRGYSDALTNNTRGSRRGSSVCSKNILIGHPSKYFMFKL